MKSRPILFSAPMVQALVAGTKTQTRRALREGDWLDLKEGVIRMANVGPATTGFQSVTCPYGEPGDHLWVREAYRFVIGYDSRPPRDVSEGTPVRYEADGLGAKQTDGWVWGKLRPSMFMPRWASRITLEVTDVRVERLQDISDVDAQAEGINPFQLAAGGRVRDRIFGYQRAYAALWEQINGPGAWDLNPWVFSVSFKRRMTA